MTPPPLPAVAAKPAYRVIVPPGWQLLPVHDDNAAVAAGVLGSARDSLPRDSYGPLIRRFEEWLTQLLDQAREGGGVDMLFPLGMPWQVPVSAGIIFSASTVSAASVLLGSGVVETDAGPALREIIDIEVKEGALAEEIVPLRSIRYTWALPGTGGTFLATGTIAGQPVTEFAPIVEALTELIDLMLNTLRWTDVTPPVDPTEQP